MPKKDGSPTVAEKRAAGTNKQSLNKAAKNTGGVKPGSVADNRAKAKEKAQTMKEYKKENNINKALTRKKEERQQPARQEREGSVAYNRANNTNTQSTGTGAGVSSQAGSQAANSSDAYKYTKADNNYSGASLRTKPINGNELYREIDNSGGYQSFYQRTEDEDGKFNTNKFFNEAIKGWENDGLSGTEKMSTEGLYQDKYNGPTNGSAWTNWAGGAQHYDAEAGVYDAMRTRVELPDDNFYKAANNYMHDGGYPGDVLKHIDQAEGEKDRLTTPEQITWYNSVVKRAQDYDWSKIYGEGKGKTHDPRGLEYGGVAHDGGGIGGTNTKFVGDKSVPGAQLGSQPQGGNQSQTNKTQANYNNSYASFNYQPNTSQYGSKQFDFKSGLGLPPVNKKTMNLNFDFDPNKFNQGQ